MHFFALKGAKSCQLPPGPILIRIGPGGEGEGGEARIGDPAQAKINAFYEDSGADRPPGVDGRILRP